MNKFTNINMTKEDIQESHKIFPKKCDIIDPANSGIETHFTKFKPKSDNIYLKLFPDYHNLSAEEQVFFLKVTEGIFGYSEQIRNETLKLLTYDYNIKYLAPHLIQFIKQSIHVNLICTDLTLLIYSVRMTKSLLVNSHVNLKLYLHEILPAILSCALTRKISKYYYDNHWTLRDFSAYVVATICHMHGNQINNILNRVISIYMIPINHSMPLTTLYGAVKGLTSLGEDTIKNYLMPNLHILGKKLYIILENHHYLIEDKQQILEAKHVRDVIINSVSPILLKTKNLTNGSEQYIREFGYFGSLMYQHVKNL